MAKQVDAQLEKDMRAGKFSVEAPKKLYKGGFVEAMLFPFRKTLFDKVVALGMDYSLPDAVSGLKSGDKNTGLAELKCGTKMKEVSGNNVLLCNPQISYTEKTKSASVAQKAPGKFDLIYKTDVDKLLGLDGGKGLLKLEERKDEGGAVARDIVCGLNYEPKKGGWKIDMKMHPLCVLQENSGNRADFKASVYYPLIKGDTSVNMAGELKGDLALPALLKPQASVALAASTRSLIGGLWYRFQDSATVGANLYKKIEVGGKPVEAAFEIFSPLNNLGGFSWIAGAQMQLNKTWTLNTKLNQKLQANLALKHQPHSAFTVQAGTLLRADDPLGGGLPNVGFKITMKA